MKRIDRKNGAAAAVEIARMRRLERVAFGIGTVVIGSVGLVLYFRYGWETFAFWFPLLVLVTIVPIFVFLRPKCPFCGVALTRNGELEAGTLLLPKCLKCGVPFDAPPEKKSAN